MQHSTLLLHALLGGLQQANHILRLLVVHLTPRGTLLEREGGGGREGGREGEEGGRERREEEEEYMYIVHCTWNNMVYSILAITCTIYIVVA